MQNGDDIIQFNPGDEFSEDDLYEVQSERRNRILRHLVGRGQISEVLTDTQLAEQDDELEHVGGPWYRLPDGRKIRGKHKAQEALDSL